MKTIDAGHGGGQVLRSALSLAALTGQAVHITHIRQNRPKPGLQPQHSACVNAVAAISGGICTGNDIGSPTVTLKPKAVHGGAYEFNIGTAGSCSLLLQCVLPPLLFAPKASTVRIVGGTDVPFAPPAYFLDRIFLAAIRATGADVALRIERHGFYPKGGGVLEAEIRPAQKLKVLDWTAQKAVAKAHAIILSCGLPAHVAEREKTALMEAGIHDVQVGTPPATGTGNVVFLQTDYAQAAAMGFDALGKIRKSAEAVAQEALDKMQAFEKTDDACEPHLLDQLLLYAAVADGQSRIRLHHLSEHAISNLRVLHEMMGTEHSFDGKVLTVQGKAPC
ncbi:RNA 3'-phosphate cyclase [Candidatus Micrarchaeota archaeon]|nr:RNA 3'-phosphate cyclase [Candidatus Micrarchaeota archaeon]